MRVVRWEVDRIIDRDAAVVLYPMPGRIVTKKPRRQSEDGLGRSSYGFCCTAAHSPSGG